MKLIKTLIVFLFQVLFFAPLSASAVRNLNFINYRSANGLVGNCVNDLAIDSAGFLWVATDCGLSRFDGAVFRNFNTVTERTMLDDAVLHLAAINDGGVLVSGYKGFFQKYCIKNDTFLAVAPKNFTQTVTSICYDGLRDNYYAHTSIGTFWDSVPQNFSLCALLNKNGMVNQCLYVDIDGRYWLLDTHTLTVYDKTATKVLFQTQVSSSRRSFTPRFIQLSPNRVMACLKVNQVEIYQITPSGQIVLESSVNLPFDGLRAVQRAVDGSFWYASDGDGLWYTAGEPSATANFEKVHPYGADDYDFCKLYTLLADKNGNIWVGTQNSGLWRYSLRSKGGSFSSSDLGLPNCPANDFCELPNGNIMATCDGLGLCEFAETATSVKLYSVADGLKNRNLTSVCADADGRLLVASWGGGLFAGSPSKNGYSFSNVSFSGVENPSSKIILCRRFQNGDIWSLMGGDGLYVCQNGHWRRQSLAHNRCLELWPGLIFEVNGNQRWLSAPNSLWKCDNGELTLFNENWFMGSGAYAVHDIVYVDNFGLVCATDSGLYVVDEAKNMFVRIDACPHKPVSSLVVDKKGRLLVTVDNSIWRIDLKEMQAERYPRDFDINGRNFFVQHSSFCSSTGNVYFGTANGFICISENDFLDETYAPKLTFSRVMADGKRVILDGKNQVTLSYGHSSLSLNIDMVDFSLLRSPLVYRMDSEAEWVSLGTEQSLNVSYLPTGNYTLQVKCLNVENAEPIELKIVVLAPWWETWWFRCLCAALLLFLIGWKLYSMSRDKIVLKQKVEERTKELNDALSTKNRIMQVVAHDLKNPVFAIYGALEQMRMRWSAMAADERNMALDKVIDSTRTVQDELGKLLAWATAKQEEQVCHLKNVNLTELVTNEVNLLELQAKEKQIEMVCDLELSRYVYADARMLGTSIRNVLGNSLKFTPSGKHISVRAWQDSAFAVIEIKDEGVGMTPEQLERLLVSSVNNSTKGTAGESGTGLGVGLAKQYMETIGGALDMTSTIGVGTTTRLKVPLGPQMEDQPAEEKPQVEATVDAELLRGNTVLVVDDDPLIAQNIKAMLDEYVEVLLADNGERALTVVAEHAVDIVVTDVDMPVMNGFELGKRLQSEPAYNHIPLLFLSARTTESDRLTGLLTGAVDYITKPFSRGELLMKLNNILLLRQRQQQRLLGEIGKLPVGEVVAEADEEKTTEPEKINPYLLKVLEVIEEHFADVNYSVEQLASDLCTSHITLYRKVKSLSGQTPLDLLTEFRLNRAHQLLKEGKTALQDVAFQTGFPDYTYFARKFKARFGCPPKDVSTL